MRSPQLPLTAARRARALLGLALAALPALAACEEETIGKLTPKGAFDPITVDFGDVTLGTERAVTVRLKSTGTAVFTIDQVQIAAPFSVASVKGALEGRAIPAGTSIELDVVFTPVSAGEATGQLVVNSAAAQATLDLRGNGVNRPVPVLSLDPTALDFGDVAVGGEGRAQVTISNTGMADGLIDHITLQSTGTDLRSGDEFLVDRGLPITVPVNGSVTLDVLFRPAQEGARSDTMLFANDGGAALQLALAGNGVIAAGDVLCNPSSLDFGPVERGMSRQLSLECSANGGPVRVFGASISQTDGYFSLPNPVSTADLQPGQSVTVNVTYTPDGLPATHTGELQLTYSGSQGNSTARVPLSGSVVPPPPTATAVSVILRWDAADTDVDLHLTRPNAIPFSPLGGDCYYANPNPDWGVQGDTTDNPFLDVDDVDGFGPENTNLESTARGNYNVLVHYFSDHTHGPTTATVEVYVAGNLAGTFQRQLQCDDVWTVGSVNWTGNGGTFAPSNAVQPQSGNGACF